LVSTQAALNRHVRHERGSDWANRGINQEPAK
jgi:hypothetical protein